MRRYEDTIFLGGGKLNPGIDAAIRRAEPPEGADLDTKTLRAAWNLARELLGTPSFTGTVDNRLPPEIMSHWWHIHRHAMGDLALDEITPTFDRAVVAKRDKLAGFDFDEVVRQARLRATECDDFSDLSDRLRWLAFGGEILHRRAQLNRKPDDPNPKPFYLDQRHAAQLMGRFLTKGKHSGKPSPGAGRDGLKVMEDRKIFKRKSSGLARADGQKSAAATFLFLGDNQSPESNIPF